MSALAYICRVFEKKNKEVAELIGVTPQTLNDWIKQKRKIPNIRLEQLEELFEIDKVIISTNATMFMYSRTHLKMYTFDSTSRILITR